jgi:hypothetical protein
VSDLTKIIVTENIHLENWCNVDGELWYTNSVSV